MRASYYAIRETGIRKFSKGGKRPKVYRYRTWQDTVARHTLSSFELVRVPTTLMYFLAYLKNILRVFVPSIYILSIPYENMKTKGLFVAFEVTRSVSNFSSEIKTWFRSTMINNIWSHYAADTSAVIASCSRTTWAQLADPCLWG